MDARLHFGFGGGGDRGLGEFERLSLRRNIGASRLELAFDGLKPAAFGESACRAGRRVRRGGKAVPAPIVAFARHQPLAGLQQCRKLRSGGAIDDADLRQTAGELRRRLDVLRQRGDAVGELWIGWIDGRAGPMHRRGVIERRIEIVAEHGAQRLLETIVDDQRVGDRRPQMLAFDREQLADGFRFGFEPLHAALGGGERLARGVDLGAGLGMRDFGAACGGFGLGERGLRGGKRIAQRRQVGLAAAGRDQAGFDIGKLGVEPRTALLVVGKRGLQLIAPRREIGQRAGQLGEGFFGRRKRGIRLGDAGVDAGQALGAGMGFGGERGLFEIEPVQRRFGVGCELALARKVGGKLLEPAVELLDALLGAGFLALQRLARDDEPLQAPRPPWPRPRAAPAVRPRPRSGACWL